MAEESPAGMPVWPLQGKETGEMTGYHSAAVIAEACVKGVKQIDFVKAYPLMKKRPIVEDYRGLAFYRKLGYIPADKEPESVSKTLEHVYDDWAVAHVASAAAAQFCGKGRFARHAATQNDHALPCSKCTSQAFGNPVHIKS